MSGTLTLKQFELSKIRLNKILHKYSDQNLYAKYSPIVSNYGAIAAVNSLLSGTKQIVTSTSSNVATEAELYSTSSSNTSLPMNSIFNLFLNDKDFYNVVTSKPYMLAFTNANTVIAWNSTSQAGSPYNVRVTNATGKTIATQSLQAYVNYLAAAELQTAAKAVDTTNYSTTTTYLVFKCIYGQQTASDNCSTVSINPWVNTEARDLMLNMNYITENLTLTGMANGNTDYNTAGVIGSIAVPNTGKWDVFEKTYNVIRDELGGTEFLKTYNALNYDRAVNRTDYNAFHDTISNINGFSRIGVIVKNSFLMKLIGKGIITFSEANTDLGVSGNKYTLTEGFKIFAEKLPVGTSGNTAWSVFNGHVWFKAACENIELAKMIATGEITFEQLVAINSASAGDGLYGDAAGNGDTAANFDLHVAKERNLIELIKNGVSINSLCASTSCSVSRAGNSVTTGTSAATEFKVTGAANAKIFDCVTSAEVVDFIKSPAVSLWQSPDLALVDVVTNLCDNA